MLVHYNMLLCGLWVLNAGVFLFCCKYDSFWDNTTDIFLWTCCRHLSECSYISLFFRTEFFITNAMTSRSKYLELQIIHFEGKYSNNMQPTLLLKHAGVTILCTTLYFILPGIFSRNTKKYTHTLRSLTKKSDLNTQQTHPELYYKSQLFIMALKVPSGKRCQLLCFCQ